MDSVARGVRGCAHRFAASAVLLESLLTDSRRKQLELEASLFPDESDEEGSLAGYYDHMQSPFEAMERQKGLLDSVLEKLEKGVLKQLYGGINDTGLLMPFVNACARAAAASSPCRLSTPQDGTQSEEGEASLL